MDDDKRPQQIGIRLPVSLKSWLEQQAATNHRSLNGEVVYRLERQREAERERAAS